MDSRMTVLQTLSL